jgi:hypothetical protein
LIEAILVGFNNLKVCEETSEHKITRFNTVLTLSLESGAKLTIVDLAGAERIDTLKTKAGPKGK